MTRYRVTVDSWGTDQPVTQQTVEGDAAPVAAWLRAVADQIDPPKRPMRSAAERTAGVLIEGDALTPGPASGLRTNIRGLPDHRDTKGPGMGFGQVNA